MASMKSRFRPSHGAKLLMLAGTLGGMRKNEHTQQKGTRKKDLKFVPFEKIDKTI
jgi:hypothetical protein